MPSELAVERVLTCVELIPAGRVAAYGDIGGIVGVRPRLVGNVLARYGAGACWWRVPNASGEFPPGLRERAYAHWRAEGTPLHPNGRGCAIGQARADLIALAEAYAARMAETLRQHGRPLPKLTAPAGRALGDAGITSLDELVEHPRAEIAALHGMGPSALARLDDAISAAGLAWR